MMQKKTKMIEVSFWSCGRPGCRKEHSTQEDAERCMSSFEQRMGEFVPSVPWGQMLTRRVLARFPAHVPVAPGDLAMIDKEFRKCSAHQASGDHFQNLSTRAKNVLQGQGLCSVEQVNEAFENESAKWLAGVGIGTFLEMAFWLDRYCPETAAKVQPEERLTREQAAGWLEEALQRIRKPSGNALGGSWQAGGCYWRLVKVLRFYVEPALAEIEGEDGAKRLKQIHGEPTGGL